MKEYVFRFMSGRPANLEKKRERAPARLVLYEGVSKSSPFKAAVGKAATLPEARRLVEELRRGGEHVRGTEQLPFDVAPGLDWALAHAKLTASDPQVKQGLKAAYSTSVSSLAGDAKLQESLLRLADTILAQTIVADSQDLELDRLTLAYRLLTFIHEVAAGAALPAEATVGDLVGRRTLIIPTIGKTAPQREEPQPPQPPAPQPDPAAEQRAALMSELAALEQAHSDLSKLAVQPSAVALQALAGADAERAVALEAQLRTLQASVARVNIEREARATGSSPATMAATKRLVLAASAAEGLSSATKQALAGLRIDLATVEPLEAVRLLEGQIAAVAAQLPAVQTMSRTIMLAGTQIDGQRLKEVFAPEGEGPGPSHEAKFCRFEAGIGDLLMVKQTLKAYELVDFAHVENVLAGETRSREHRRLDTSETITTTEETTEKQKETDLQSTQRNEMQTEADKTVKEQFGLEAGVQVSGSYGPSVQFSTHLNANYSTASEETQRKALSFSQEVTEKTSQSIRETLKKAVTHRVLEEIQEINTHAFVNTSPEKDIRGIYRWLDKVYDAEILNYGQRMLYEFVVPEPAAYFLYAMVENPPPEDVLVKPDPPTFNGAPLKPSNLTRGNYGDYVAGYQVSGVPAPPTEMQTASYFDKQDGGDTASFGRAGKIDIPDGYEAYAAVVASDYVFEEGEGTSFRVMLGNTNFDRTGVWGTDYSAIEARQRELAVAYELMDVKSFTIGIDVLCRLTSAGFAKWQQSVFDSITQAYLQQKSDYEQALAVKAVQSGSGQLGRNPAENLRITKEELKKLVLMILTGSDAIARNSFLSTSEPLMDLDKVCPNGSWIRFFEDAFEWTNIIYVLYSYFWGRHSRWSSALHFTDPDPEFAAFLRAGAARIQIPVRPGFEKAVAYFCQYGEIWDGSEPPLREDELYVPIVEEIAANLGAYEGEGVPYPEGAEPWEVHVPTELVLVEDLSEVPNIRDVLTGNDVTIHE